MVHPDFEVLEEGEDPQLQRIIAIYLRPGGLPLSLMRKWIAQAIESYGGYLPSCLPLEAVQRFGLMPVARALAHLHDPALDTDLDALNRFESAAHRTIIFDELFFLQLGLGLRKRRRIDHAGMMFPRQAAGLTTKMLGLLPFKLTGAQRRVLQEIDADMNSARPMQRLVQGDVGSGKTMVAWLASLRVIQHGYQALWMAPTELLAEQHFRNLKRYCDELGIRSALLTASLGAKAKAAGAGADRKRRHPICRRHPRADSGKRARAAHGSGRGRRTAPLRCVAALVAAESHSARQLGQLARISAAHAADERDADPAQLGDGALRRS